MPPTIKFTDPCPDWKDLPDQEIRTRLIHHGCDVLESKTLVKGRDQMKYASQINEILTSETDGVQQDERDLLRKIEELQAELAAAKDAAKVKL